MFTTRETTSRLCSRALPSLYRASPESPSLSRHKDVLAISAMFSSSLVPMLVSALLAMLSIAEVAASPSLRQLPRMCPPMGTPALSLAAVKMDCTMLSVVLCLLLPLPLRRS